MSETWEKFAALGDRHRLEIFRRASNAGKSPMHRLFEGLPISRQAAAKHVQILCAAGLLRLQKRGREQLVTVDPDNLRLAKLFLTHMEEVWTDRLAQLKEISELPATKAPGSKTTKESVQT